VIQIFASTHSLPFDVAEQANFTKVESNPQFSFDFFPSDDKSSFLDYTMNKDNVMEKRKEKDIPKHENEIMEELESSKSICSNSKNTTFIGCILC
jgi:hypothetical protein